MRALAEPIRRVARAIPGAMVLGRWLHRTLDADLREVDRLRRCEHARLFQPFPDTAEERYPDLFDALAARLASIPAPRILSFGCSSGAEVRALRRRLPAARIVGLDLNRRAIARARAADPGGDYRIAAAPNANERFDAILAMAVFRHGDLEARQPRDCSQILPFARFDSGLGALLGHLADDGWLALYHAHFRPRDSQHGRWLAEDPFRMAGQPPQNLLYDPANQRIANAEERTVLYRKIGRDGEWRARNDSNVRPSDS